MERLVGRVATTLEIAWIRARGGLHTLIAMGLFSLLILSTWAFFDLFGPVPPLPSQLPTELTTTWFIATTAGNIVTFCLSAFVLNYLTKTTR